MIRFVAAFALAVCALPAAAATTATVDYSDLWWNPSESGWAAGLNQQGDVVFMTLYVFGANGAGTWFSSDLHPLTFVAPAPPTYQGTLYRVSGPPFNGPFNPASVSSLSVGTATIAFPGANSGTITYTVNGVSVTKNISRQTFAAPSLAGSYNGGITAAASQCGDPTLKGNVDIQGPMTVTHANDAVTFVFTSNVNNGTASRCTHRGTYVQTGRLGTVTGGTFSCAVNVGADDRGEGPRNVNFLGTYTLDRIEAGSNGFYGNYTATDQFCVYSGKFGGTRTAQ
jgi:hypothetical protein